MPSIFRALLRVTAALALLTLLQAAALGCAAAPQDPAVPVREAYRIERLSLEARRTTAEGRSDRGRTESTSPPWFPVNRPRIFSRRLITLWEAEDRLQAAVQGVANIDHDPFLEAQDFPVDVLHDLAIDVAERRQDRAVVRARFTVFHEARELRFDVLYESNRWLIDDLRGTSGHSLAAMLGRPL
jgi:hypothetical protein